MVECFKPTVDKYCLELFITFKFEINFYVIYASNLKTFYFIIYYVLDVKIKFNYSWATTQNEDTFVLFQTIDE